jgi:hypothetical protein
MTVILYTDKSYRGGHYFGKIGLSSKKESLKALKHGTREVKIGDLTLNVLKHSPKITKSVEYWECPKCYWRRW